MKVIIVDDEQLIREGMKIVLSTYPDLEVTGECADGMEAYEFCKDHEVDIVLMDIRMPGCDGVTGTKLIKELNPDIKVLVLTTFKDTEYIKDAMSNGASGYLLKDSSYEDIYKGIKAVYDGNIVIHPDAVKSILENAKNTRNNQNANTDKEQEQDLQLLKSRYQLTAREIDVMKLVAKGFSNKEIADSIFITEGAVKNNITSILSKLELRDRTQLAIFVLNHKLG